MVGMAPKDACAGGNVRHNGHRAGRGRRRVAHVGHLRGLRVPHVILRLNLASRDLTLYRQAILTELEAVPGIKEVLACDDELAEADTRRTWTRSTSCPTDR